MFLPQMSPMWWTMLMFTFIFSFILSMCMLNFSTTVFMKSKKKEMKKNLNWVW